MGTDSGRLGVVEFALTGDDPDTDRVVAARVAVLDEYGLELERWDWGTDRGDALVGEVAQTLRTLRVAGVPIATFDAATGLTTLDRECRRRHLPGLDLLSPVLDPLLLDHLLEPALGANRPLPELAARYGVDAGSLVAGRLVRVMVERLGGSADELHDRQAALLDGWPVIPLDDIRLIEDTQPFPAPPPRPSDTVPTIDFGDGMLQLESSVPVTRGPVAAEPVAERSVVVAVPSTGEPRPTAEPVAAEPAPSRAKARRIHVAAAIVTDPAGRALVVRKRGTTGFMQPGGKIERGESALACLVRELREELGLEVVVDQTEFLGSFEADALNEPGARVRAEVFALVTDAHLAPGLEIEELHWLRSPDDVGSVPLAPLTTEVLIPLWVARRPALH